jgi:hypothetical protein
MVAQPRAPEQGTVASARFLDFADILSVAKDLSPNPSRTTQVNPFQQYVLI